METGERSEPQRMEGDPLASSRHFSQGEAPVVSETIVEQVVAAIGRGESLSGIARAYGLDRKTVRAWSRRGAYQARVLRATASVVDPFRAWLEQRAPEVHFNASVLHRELKAQGFMGSSVIVRRAVRPLRAAAVPRAATVRFETGPGEQAQVDFGQVRVWIAEGQMAVQIFVMTLGYSRRCFAAAFPRQRLRDWLAGHELAFHHFGGVTDTVVVDNAKAMVLQHTREAVTWNSTYADFAGYYGFRPWACAPYRPQTKGKVESGVKYVARNALAGKRFHSWAHLNAWLTEWCLTVADHRVHGTTHEVPATRFATEALTGLDGRPPYAWSHVRQRRVANDALVSIDGSRYSVPAQWIGTAVTVREQASDFTIHAGDVEVARHARHARHHVIMNPDHYAGLLRVDRTPLALQPPQHDPRYADRGVVTTRDLAVYEQYAEPYAEVGA